MSKTVYVTVKVKVKDNADIREVVQEMNYDFQHQDIVETEIVEYDDGDN